MKISFYHDLHNILKKAYIDVGFEAWIRGRELTPNDHADSAAIRATSHILDFLEETGLISRTQDGEIIFIKEDYASVPKEALSNDGG